MSNYRSRTPGEAGDETVLEIDAFDAYARPSRAARRAARATPVVDAVPVRKPSRMPRRRFGALATFAAIVTGICSLAATLRIVEHQPETPAQIADVGPADRTGSVVAATVEPAAPDIRAISLARDSVTVPLPRLRPDRAIATAAIESRPAAPTAEGRNVPMESHLARAEASDPDPELVARIERALAETPFEAPPPLDLAPQTAEGVLARMEPALPEPQAPLPAGLKLPPEEIPFAPVGNV